MSNLELWDSVQETNPADTKAVSFGRKFTAIDAYSQIKKATEQFGPYGIAWGLKDLHHTFLPTDKMEKAAMVMAIATFFIPDGESSVSSSIFYVSEKGKADDDFAKKLETDMITKALSILGFNADVFMGKFDDNRYVAAMKQKHQQISPEPIREAVVDGAYNAFKEEIDKDEGAVDIERIQSGYGRLTNDEKIAVSSKFGQVKPEESTKMYKSLLKEYVGMKKIGDEWVK